MYDCYMLCIVVYCTIYYLLVITCIEYTMTINNYHAPLKHVTANSLTHYLFSLYFLTPYSGKIWRALNLEKTRKTVTN